MLEPKPEEPKTFECNGRQVTLTPANPGYDFTTDRGEYGYVNVKTMAEAETMMSSLLPEKRTK